MLNSLDPHSSFFTADEMQELRQETTGAFSGVGVEITMKDNIITVISPIEGTPAFRAGIRSGDQIISIDGKAAAEMTLLEAVKLIRGDVGSQVTFQILRPGVKESFPVTMMRDKIPMISIRAQDLGKGIGYVHIRNFQGGTTAELEKAIKTFVGKKDSTGFILDLRNDPGGLLEQSVAVSGLFVGMVPVVETRGRRPDQNMVYKSEKKAILPLEIPMIVLVNEGSASASEIVAGALQDYGRALILGTQTYGKGSVQSVVPLPDGSGMRLTTARFYTPLGRAIQSEGINPDVVVKNPLPPDYQLSREIDLEGHLRGANEGSPSATPPNPSQDTEPVPDDTPAEPYVAPDKHFTQMTPAERLATDKQLAAAFDLLTKGEVVNTFTGDISRLVTLPGESQVIPPLPGDTSALPIDPLGLV
jgi:carboxyl-terminal processing protease